MRERFPQKEGVAIAVVDEEPLPAFEVGQEVALMGEIVEISPTSITIQIADTTVANCHRVTITPTQFAALKGL